MSAISVGGDLVHYEVLGRGRPVILLHGWIGSWRYWIPAMRFLQLKYRVYAIDFFGYGDSGKNAEKYSINHQVYLLEDFMRQLGIPKAALIGHGLGAQVLIQFARKNPEKVALMTLANAPLFDPGNLMSRPMPNRTNPLTASNDPNPLATTRRLIEEAEREAARDMDSHTADTIRRRPKEFDDLLRTADATLPSGSNQTITDPARLVDREKLRQMSEAALARGEAAMRGDEPRSPAIPADNPLKDRIGLFSADALLARCFRRSEPEYEKIQADIARMDEAVVRRTTLNFDAGKLLDTIRELELQMVILHGSEDPLIEAPSDDVWQYITQEREKYVLPVPLNGVRHFPMLEYEPFMRLLNEFLEVGDISKIQVKGIERWRRRAR